MATIKDVLNGDIIEHVSRIEIFPAIDIWFDNKESDNIYRQNWVENKGDAIKLAHLMKAAPEMLEALETLVEEEWTKGSEFEKYVLSLIKKAKGE